MHDDRINCIVFNAFNGFGDSTGSDDFGVSIAWIDLDDHMEADGLDNHELYPYSQDVSEHVKTHPHIAGCRYALAYWHADGVRDVLGFDTREDMLNAYRAWEDDFAAWEGAE